MSSPRCRSTYARRFQAWARLGGENYPVSVLDEWNSMAQVLGEALIVVA